MQADETDFVRDVQQLRMRQYKKKIKCVEIPRHHVIVTLTEKNPDFIQRDYIPGARKRTHSRKLRDANRVFFPCARNSIVFVKKEDG